MCQVAVLLLSVHVNMHVWQVTMTGVPELSGKGVRDEDVAESAPLVRALVVQRLEQMWSVVQPHLDGSTGKPDPRFLEAGIRINDRLIRLYRLDAPVPNQDGGEGDRVPLVDLVTKGLAEIEARLADGSLIANG